MAISLPAFSKYRLLARLGSGGMADVYLAAARGPSGFTKLEVLKVLRLDAEQDSSELVRMFQAEARLAARLNHPNIVQAHGVGSEGGQHFMAMEYLEGQPLSRVQRRAWASRAACPLELQLLVLCDVLDALEYAHNLTDYDGAPLRVVHRDVSPQNVIITYSGQTKLVDFGIAKTFESGRTRPGVVKGKVPYMSPEQVLNRPVDARSDLFSVGVMLWSAIAGRNMHARGSAYEMQQRLLLGELPSLRAAAPNVPERLEAIVERALAHDPADRYPDAASFRRDLAEFLGGRHELSTRDVGECVASLFARERAEMSGVIQGAMLEAETGVLVRAVDLGPESAYGRSPTPEWRAPVTPHQPAPHASASSRGLSSRWVFAAALLAAAGAGALSATLQSSVSRSASAAGSSASGAPPAVSPIPAVADTPGVAPTPAVAPAPSELTRAAVELPVQQVTASPAKSSGVALARAARPQAPRREHEPAFIRDLPRPRLPELLPLFDSVDPWAPEGAHGDSAAIERGGEP